MSDKKIYEKEAEFVAETLIGKTVKYNGKIAVITETEAYGDDDPFCYGIRYGKTQKNSVSFMKGGHIFLYAGMFMITAGSSDGSPQNVLIRKLNIPQCGGPYNLRKYFGFPKELNGKKLGEESGLFISGKTAPSERRKRGKFNVHKATEEYAHRQGIPERAAFEKVTRYRDIDWRFCIK